MPIISQLNKSKKKNVLYNSVNKTSQPNTTIQSNKSFYFKILTLNSNK